jgi:hypothetical protein
MDYYFCSPEDLRQEISRRGYFPVGGQDELSEELKKDDENRGTDATTIKTTDCAQFTPKQKLQRLHQAPGSVHPSLLVGERITHWTLDTFFPTLQLFFESGLSCTLEGGYRQSARVGLDQHLRFRLTDLTHEEGGFVAKSTLPQKPYGPPKSIKIMEATLAERTSLAVQSIPPAFGNGSTNGRPSSRPSSRPSAELRTETHVVIGLRLEGMQKMGYVWAKIDDPPPNSNCRTWHDVSIVGLRDDVPVPFVVFPQRNSKMGSKVSIVRKDSMISPECNGFGGYTDANGINGTKSNGTNGVHADSPWHI